MARKAGQGKEEEESRARQQEEKTPVREGEKTPARHGRGHHVVEQGSPLCRELCSSVVPRLSSVHPELYSSVVPRLSSVHPELCSSVVPRFSAVHPELCSSVVPRFSAVHPELCSSVVPRFSAVHPELCSSVAVIQSCAALWIPGSPLCIQSCAALWFAVAEQHCSCSVVSKKYPLMSTCEGQKRAWDSLELELWMFVCSHVSPGTCEGQKRAWDSLELDLWMFVCSHKNADLETRQDKDARKPRRSSAHCPPLRNGCSGRQMCLQLGLPRAGDRESKKQVRSKHNTEGCSCKRFPIDILEDSLGKEVVGE
ncbi:hypothetical protein STEG23_029130, partial [Scotinomys teguina]